MDAVRESCFYYLLSRLGGGFMRLWNAGLTGLLWRRFTAWVTAVVEKSLFYRLLTSELGWVELWRKSLLHAVLDCLINLIPRLLGKLFGRIEPKLELSCTGHILDALAEKRHVLMGLYFMAMLCMPYDYWNNLYGAVGAIALFALYYFWAAPRRKAELIPVRELGAMYFVFLLAVVLAFFLSQHPMLSLKFVVFHFSCALIVLTICGAVDSLAQLKTILRFVLAGLLVAALYGCVQIVTGVEFLAYQIDMSINAGITGRIYSFFSNPNNYHTFITMLLPFALAMFFTAKNLRGRLFCAAVLLVTLVASAATYSRSGWIGLIAAVLVFTLFMDWRYLVLLAAFGIAALPLLPDTIITRLLTIGNMKDSSSKYRLQIFAAFRRLLKSWWTTGVGLGTENTYAVLHEFPAMEDGNFALHSHNNYMQLCAEIGITGAFAYVATLIGRLKNLAAAAVGGCNRELRAYIAASAGAMFGIMIMGLVDYTWYYPRSMFFFWFLFGVMALCVKLRRKEN